MYFFYPDGGGYPLWLGAGIADDAEFWRQMTALSLQNLKQLRVGRLRATAIRWLIGTDRAVKNLGIAAEPFWRLYASSLILPLGENVDPREDVRDRLQQAIGGRNWRFLTGCGTNHVNTIPASAIPRASSNSSSRPKGSLWSDDTGSLRELTHSVLGQLFQPADLRIPMVLYAWQRNLNR